LTLNHTLQLLGMSALWGAGFMPKRCSAQQGTKLGPGRWLGGAPVMGEQPGRRQLSLLQRRRFASSRPSTAQYSSGCRT
jgi:hypothetical protein